MKFKIRFADQIVGFSIIFSLICIALVAVMLGRSQRWFSNDVSFKTVLSSAGGLSKNMAVQYRGFTIGSIKSFVLMDDDNVEVKFDIYEEYRDRVKQGSLVEMMISPIGLGNQFLFHPGRGELLQDGVIIPVVGSAQARELVRQGLAQEQQYDDSLNLIMNRVSSILDEFNQIAAHLNEALGVGSDITEIGKIIGSLTKTMAGVEILPLTVDQAVVSLTRVIEDIQEQLEPILSNLEGLTSELNDPDNLVYAILDTDKDVYTNLVDILRSVSSMIASLDRTVAFIPGQLPQLAALITDLRLTLTTAEDVLTALTNNPLLKGGIPERPETQGIGPRGIGF